MKKLTVSTLTALTLALSAPLLVTGCDNDDDKHHAHHADAEDMGSDTDGQQTDDQTQDQTNDTDNQVAFATVVAAAQATGDLSTLVEAVVVADLADTLSATDTPAPFTVFAPTNQAFADLLSATGLTKQQLMADKDLLTKVLTYHVVAGAEVKASDIMFGQPIQTINGGAITINKDTDGKPYILDAKGNKSMIVTTDVQTGNGVVHIIDTVVMPVDNNLVAVAQANEDFSILVEAVVAAGLADTLANTKNLTVFAPTNDAFVALLDELGVKKEQLFADKALLTQVLTYHVVPDLVYSSEVASGEVATLQGDKFSFDDNANLIDARGRQAGLVATDVQASNGVIHVIDKVILPSK